MSNALRYWETCRIYYNLVLLVLVLCFWGNEFVTATPMQWIGILMVLGVLALIANLLYCAAYAIEFSFYWLFQEQPGTLFRWTVFCAGLGLAVLLELWVMFHQGMA